MELDASNITLLCTLGGLVIAFLSYNLGKRKEDKQEIKDDTTAQTSLAKELEYIKEGIDDIKLQIRDIKNDTKSLQEKMGSLSERVTRTEESAKQAHKRLDDLEKRFSEWERK